MSAKDDVEYVTEIKERKWYRAAMRGVTYLRRRYEKGVNEPVSSKRMMEVCGLRLHKHWAGCLILIKEILGGEGLDLANYPGRGYFICYVPKMTLREVIKSLLRAFSHTGSARKRREKYASELDAIEDVELRLVLNSTDSVIEVLGSAMDGSSRVLKRAIKKIDGLSDAGDDVANPLRRLLDEPLDDDSPRRSVQQRLDAVGKTHGEEESSQTDLFDDDSDD